MTANSDEILDALMTSEDVADLLGVKVETVYHYKAQGKMPAPLLEVRGPLWERSLIEGWAERRRKHAGATDQG